QLDRAYKQCNGRISSELYSPKAAKAQQPWRSTRVHEPRTVTRRRRGFDDLERILVEFEPALIGRDSDILALNPDGERHAVGGAARFLHHVCTYATRLHRLRCQHDRGRRFLAVVTCRSCHHYHCKREDSPLPHT